MADIKATPYARKVAAQYHIDLAAVSPGGPDGAIHARDVIRAKDGRKKTPEASVTPLAQRIAESMHLDLKEIRGTGIGGRISKADVLRHAGRQDIQLQPGELCQTMNSMRRAIAAEMTEAAQIPTVTVTTKVDVTRLTELRLAVNEKRKVHYTVNDLVLMAVAKALPKNKRLLCSAAGDSIIYKNDVNLGISVSLDEGIIVPVLRDADKLTAEELASKAHDLIRRTREKKISPDECRGVTFTVTNLGMYGVEAFTPVLHLPCAAILGVCSIYDGCAVKDGAVEVRKLMHICLTFDHRLLDGAQAAKFNLSVREFLEHPEALIGDL
ncbi:MAG: 2-oxo acid dehydrogenase subunit E2 [Lachnospiraceae bacterium]|nr:2-oxo acid dehydrogenase subunit E2 [Lachnospiraceae bacterium]